MVVAMLRWLLPWLKRRIRNVSNPHVYRGSDAALPRPKEPTTNSLLGPSLTGGLRQHLNRKVHQLPENLDTGPLLQTRSTEQSNKPGSKKQSGIELYNTHLNTRNCEN